MALFLGPTNGAIPLTERNALIALYNSADGDNWTDNTGWNGAAGTECDWFGVTCWGDHVTTLDLHSNNLVGSIPSDLANLRNLQYLVLNNNDLSGSIPSQLGDMSSLLYLILNNNQLSGSIPSHLSGLTNLVYLYLNDNQLSGNIPTQLGNLSNLLYFLLNNNQLTGNIPSELGNLNSLQYLYLYENQLSGSIPTHLGDLPNLIYFLLNNNTLSGSIPPNLGKLGNVQYFYLHHNQLTGQIPSDLGTMSNVQLLLLDSNSLQGSIPSQLGNLHKLTQLNLGANRLADNLPSELGNLTKLQYLFLHSNHFGGEIPTQLQSLTNLNDGSGLRIEYNALHTDNSTLRDFLNTKQNGGDFESTQTVAPTDLAWTGAKASGNLSWTVIDYTGDTGAYKIYLSTSSGGPYDYIGDTSDKTVSSYELTDLLELTWYYAVIRTYTNPHGENQNIVTSEDSDELAFETGSDCTPPSITGQPEGQIICSGETATLSVTVTGTTPMQYQWYQGISGETTTPVGTDSNTYTTPVLTDTTNYWVYVSNNCGNACSSTATVTVTDGHGIAGNALEFNGTDEFGQMSFVPQCFDSVSTSSFTMEFWAYMDDFSTGKTLIDITKDSSNFAQFTISEANNINFCVYDGTTYRSVRKSDSDLVTGQWYHVTGVWNYTDDSLTLYIDAASYTTSGVVTSAGTDDSFSIGSRTDSSQYFDGKLDEMRLWNHARPADEIGAITNKRQQGNEAGLIGYWRFDEFSGTTATDQTSYANDGTVSGQWTPSTVPLKADPFPGKGLYFNGSDEYVVTSNSGPIVLDGDDQSVTYECWFKPSSVNTHHSSVLYADGNNDQGIQLCVSPDGTTIDGYMNIGDWHDVVAGTVTADAWNHVAIIFNYETDEVATYVNGTLANTDTGNTGSFDGITTVYFGSDEGSAQFYKGEIDEIRIWNKVRTPQEIRESTHKTLDGDEDGLVGYWQCNEGSGTTTLDYKYGNDGTLTNMDDSNWIDSPTPVGGGTSNYISSFTSGTATLGTVTITTVNAFDNPVDICVTKLSRAPNTLPDSITETKLRDRYWVINLFGDPGTFNTKVKFTLPNGYINVDDSLLKLYKRNNDDIDSTDWSGIGTLGTGGDAPTSSTATFVNIQEFSQFTITTAGGSPLVVDLVSFTAKGLCDRVLLEWETASEIDCAGFDVWRSDAKNGDYVRINYHLIPSRGGATWGAAYCFVDENVSPGHRYYYKLRDIEYDGTSAFHGPVSASVNGIEIGPIFKGHGTQTREGLDRK